MLLWSIHPSSSGNRYKPFARRDVFSGSSSESILIARSRANCDLKVRVIEEEIDGEKVEALSLLRLPLRLSETRSLVREGREAATLRGSSRYRFAKMHRSRLIN